MTDDTSGLVRGLRLAGYLERRRGGGESAPTLYDQAADEIERLRSLVAKFDQMMDLIVDTIPPKDQAE